MNHLRFRQYSFDRFYYWGYEEDYFVSPSFIKEPSDRFTQLEVSGQDLWENDLVKWKGHLAKVYWSPIFNGWSLLNIQEHLKEIPIGINGIPVEEITIVGNIYQNKDLINEYLN